MLYLEYLNPQYIYEMIFWVITFFLLKRFWNKTEVRLVYGYITAGLNLLAVGFFVFISINGSFKFFDGIAFSFLHIIVALICLHLLFSAKN